MSATTMIETCSVNTPAKFKFDMEPKDETVLKDDDSKLEP